MKCTKCHAALAEGSRFCNFCGTPQALTEVPAEEDPLAGTSEGGPAGSEGDSAVTVAPSKKRSRRLLLLILSASLLLLIAGAILLFIFFQPKPNNYILYIKDGDLYYSAVSEISPLQVTDGLEALDPSAAFATTLTKDGKRLFYLDASRNADSGQALYCRDLTDPASAAQRIASDVLEYSVNDAGDCVTYLRSEQDTVVLYQYHAENERKIATDVVSHFVSADGQTILYTDQDGALYIQKNGAQRIKLDDAVSEVVHADRALAQIYYFKNGALYSSTGERGKWIASDVLDVTVLESGELYYLKENKAVVFSAKDLIDRESVIAYLAELGGAVISEERFWSMMDTQLADRLGKVKILYHRDTDGTVTPVCETYLSARLERSEKAVLVYDVYDPADVEKMDLTVDAADWSASLFKIISSVKKTYIALGERAISLGVDGASSFFMDDACKYLCYLVYDIDALDANLSEGTLYRAELSGQDVGRVERIDSGVYEEGVVVTRDGKCFYLKHAVRDGNDLSADLYCDGKRICREISVSDITYHPATDRLLFMTDWSSTDLLGTLMYYQGGEVVTVADEAHDYVCTPGGEILYLTNWNGKRGRGELYLYRDGRSELIDDAVSGIIPVGG